MLPLKYSNIFRRASASIYPRVVTAKGFASGSTIIEDDPSLIEVEKRRNLSKKQHYTSTTLDEAPGWNEYLASASEAHVKADRQGNDGPPTIELTERTIKHVQRRYHGDGFPRSSREEASYERDEVEGPLKTISTGDADKVMADEMQGKTTSGKETLKAERGDL